MRRPIEMISKGYENPTGHSTVEKHEYIGHIRPIKEEGAKKHKGKPRRWVVERTLGWLNLVSSGRPPGVETPGSTNEVPFGDYGQRCAPTA